MTSNVGASMITTTSKLGFSTSDDESKDKYEKLKETVTEEMKKMCIRDSLRMKLAELFIK